MFRYRSFHTPEMIMENWPPTTAQQKEILPAQDHPELQRGEVFLCDCSADEPDDFANIEYQTKRAGVTSYWPDRSVKKHYFPVFVYEIEYRKIHLEVKIGQ